MKRVFSLLLALLMVAVVSVHAIAAEEKTHMDLTVSFWDIENSFPEGKDRDRILTTIEEKFNVTFTPMNVGWGDYRDKMNTWAASGSLPDITGGIAWIGRGTFNTWINDGVVRALPDDMSEYPNISKYMNLPEVKAYQSDGKNYFLPRMTYDDPSYWNMDRGLLIRKDWLKNLGLDMPTTAEELLDVMRAFTEDDPDQNGANDTIGFGFNSIYPTSQIIASFGYTDLRWVKMEDGTWRQPTFEAVSLPVIDYLRTAYKNGWMDQDFASRPSGFYVRDELFATGRLGIMGYQNTVRTGFNSGLKREKITV